MFHYQKEAEQAKGELRVLQERLEASERSTEALRRDLSELGGLQSHSHAELHQVRLQAAQMTLQLSQANLAFREGQATWAQERESMRQNLEVRRTRNYLLLQTDVEEVLKVIHYVNSLSAEWCF